MSDVSHTRKSHEESHWEKAIEIIPTLERSPSPRVWWVKVESGLDFVMWSAALDLSAHY